MSEKPVLKLVKSLPMNSPEELVSQLRAVTDGVTPGPWRVGGHYSFAGVRDESRPDIGFPPHIAKGRCCSCTGAPEPCPLTLFGRDIVGHSGVEPNRLYHAKWLDCGDEGVDDDGNVRDPILDWHRIASGATLQAIAGNYDVGTGGICSKAEDAHFCADARELVPQAADTIVVLMAERDAFRMERNALWDALKSRSEDHLADRAKLEGQVRKLLQIADLLIKTEGRVGAAALDVFLATAEVDSLANPTAPKPSPPVP